MRETGHAYSRYPCTHVNYDGILGAVSMHCVNAILGTSSLYFTHLPQRCQSISSNLILSKKKMVMCPISSEIHFF